MRSAVTILAAAIVAAAAWYAPPVEWTQTEAGHTQRVTASGHVRHHPQCTACKKGSLSP